MYASRAGPAGAGDGLIVLTTDHRGEITVSNGALTPTDDPTSSVSMDTATGELTADGGHVEMVGRRLSVGGGEATLTLDITC